MGGQACVFYGAAEFSRDLDLLLLVEHDNLARFQSALETLRAKPIAVPELDPSLLARGHAVHFRCHAVGVHGLRIDTMSVLRGVASFQKLWERRTTIDIDGQEVDLLSLEDLVLAKKTQRDKDWPMIRRLVEQSYFGQSSEASEPTVEFWLRELRTPELLITVAAAHPETASRIRTRRPTVEAAIRGDTPEVSRLLTL